MSHDIKSCPFCGSDKIKIKQVLETVGMGDNRKNWLIYCSKCNVQKTFPADDWYGRESYTEEEVIAWWNTRK